MKHNTRGDERNGKREEMSEDEWSGRRESNPCLDLGKVPYYRYTTTASINL